MTLKGIEMQWNNSDRLVAWGVLVFGVIFICQVSWTYRKHRQYIRDVSRERDSGTLAFRVFNRLQVSARSGQCDEGLWAKARWGSQSSAKTLGGSQPATVEMKSMVCAALADGVWGFDDVISLSGDEKAYAWRPREPLMSINAITITVKRPALGQPYEVTSWSAYPPFDGVLQPWPADSDK